MAFEKVTFGDNLPGFELGDKTAPAVIVIQEWWGVTDQIKAHATKLHEKGGYRVLVPDLYKGKVGVDAEEAHHLMDALDFKQAIEELKRAAAYLKTTGSPKVGVVGFCMGGALTFLAAQHADVDAAAPFYGTANPALSQVEKITIPVQAHFGRDDAHKGFSDVETAEATRDKMVNSPEFHFYDHAGHGFLNDSEDAVTKLKGMGAVIPSQETRDLAWSRLLDFFAKHLK